MFPMRFNSVLISSFLLVSAGLADCRHMDRRSRGVGRLTNVPSSKDIDSLSLAGAVWEKSGGTFYSVEGTFKVPKISGPNGYSAAAWVGIDGVTCQGSALRTGVAFTVTPSGPLYRAWYEWSPTIPGMDPYSTPPVTISAGDVVRLVISAPKTTFAYMMIENTSNDQSSIQHLNSTVALCGQDVGWGVADYILNGALVPLVDFGTVNFTDAKAGLNTGGTIGPQGATLLELMEGGITMSNVSVTEDKVSIKYAVRPP